MREIGRLSSIAGVLAKHGFGELGERLFRRPEEKPPEIRGERNLRRAMLPSPRRIRLVLEDLGPSFVKLGQLMSTRADVFPPDYIDELRKLQDSVPPVAFREIRGVVERSLGRPLLDVFADFDTEPVAAASVAQVHLARLFSGESVAVKVVRPGIGKRIREDVRLMYALAERLEQFSHAARILGLTNVVQEFERTIFRELDMLIEAGNIEKFAVNFQGASEIHIPTVYWDYTTKSVLVMERIEGIKMDQVEEIRARGIDPKEVAMIGLRSFSRQLMDFGFFHADPHPGNTIVMYDGRVSLIDFGITGYLDEETMRQIAHLFLGYAERDYDMVVDALREAGVLQEGAVDLRAFRTDLKDISEPFYGRSLRHISVMDVYEQVMWLLLKYRIRLPRNLLLLLKTFVQTEALGKILGSDASILEVTKPYAKNLLQRSLGSRNVLGGLDRDLRNLVGYARAAPKALHDILGNVARGRQRIELAHEGLSELDTQLEKGVNRLTVGLVVAASVIAAALILNSSQRVFQFSIASLGLHDVPITAALGLTGFIIATVLGLWLILSIFRSGKL